MPIANLPMQSQQIKMIEKKLGIKPDGGRPYVGFIPEFKIAISRCFQFKAIIIHLSQAKGSPQGPSDDLRGRQVSQVWMMLCK